MKEDICKHCLEPERQHHSFDKWCPYRSEHGHFISWNHEHTFEGMNIFKELERLKNWQKDAVIVLNKWYKVSDFLAKNNLVGLGEDYSTKCLDVLKSLTEQVEKLDKQLRSITGSMAAHPDCIEGSEFWDMVRISEKCLNPSEEDIKNALLKQVEEKYSKRKY